MQGHDELVVGGVLIAPFVRYAFEAALLTLFFRPVLRKAGVEDAFSNPPLLILSIYVVSLTTLVVLR